MTSPTPLIASNLACVAGGVHVVTTDISVTLAPGMEPQGIVGPSGAGKTALAETLLGNEKPASGTVLWAGRSVSRLGRRDKKLFKAAVRAVHQNGFDNEIEPTFTGMKALTNALSAARKAGRSTGMDAEDLRALMELEPRVLQMQIGRMSGGERQRVKLAIALATNPDIMILDEPFTALDEQLKELVARRLQDLVAKRGTGLLLFSHDLALVGKLCPTVRVLADGQFVQTGSMQELLANPAHPFVQDLADNYQHSTRVVRPA